MLATRDELVTRIEPGYSFALHVIALHAVVLAVAGTALAFVRDLDPRELVAVPITFLFANVVEYLAHRGPMHHKMPGFGILFARHTEAHHAFFRMESMRVQDSREMRFVLFPSWAAGLVLLTASPVGLLVAFLTTRNQGLLYVATAASYYLLYEWLHASYHLAPEKIARVPLLGAAAARHALHHDPSHMTRVNFNITFPIIDIIVGTYSG